MIMLGILPWQLLLLYIKSIEITDYINTKIYDDVGKTCIPSNTVYYLLSSE